MKVEITNNNCKVIREPGDPKFKNGTWGSGESRLLYHVKRILNEKGYDLIKKRMWKDGHLVDDQQQYLRSRSKTGNGICIYNGKWQIAGAEEDFNTRGFVNLCVVSS